MALDWNVVCPRAWPPTSNHRIGIVSESIGAIGLVCCPFLHPEFLKLTEKPQDRRKVYRVGGLALSASAGDHSRARESVLVHGHVSKEYLPISAIGKGHV